MPLLNAAARHSLTWTLVFFLLTLLCAAPPAIAQQIIQPHQVLTLPQCVDIAVQRHPSITSAQSSVQISESRVGQARAAYYPQTYLSTQFTRGYPSLLRGTTYSDYAAGVTLSQNIFDFGKTGTQVDIQKINVSAARSDASYTISQVILGVKLAYFSVLRTQRARAVAQESVNQFEQHLKQAAAFFEVGMKPRFDVTKAEVDLSNARLNLLTAENNLQVARVNLNNAMGLPSAPPYTIEDSFTFVKYDMTFENALAAAYTNRSDLQALIASKEAAMKTVELFKKNYYPVLTGNASYFYGGPDFPLEREWTAGAALNFPLFTGYSTKYQIGEAKASVNVLNANETSLRQSILLEIQQDFLALREAEDRIATAELAVRQATENYDIANGRYAAGVGSPIEVTDALVALSNAKLTHIAAIYDYKTAQATIEKAMGAN